MCIISIIIEITGAIIHSSLHVIYLNAFIMQHVRMKFEDILDTVLRRISLSVPCGLQTYTEWFFVQIDRKIQSKKATLLFLFLFFIDDTASSVDDFIGNKATIQKCLWYIKNDKTFAEWILKNFQDIWESGPLICCRSVRPGISKSNIPIFVYRSRVYSSL